MNSISKSKFFKLSKSIKFCLYKLYCILLQNFKLSNKDLKLFPGQILSNVSVNPYNLKILYILNFSDIFKFSEQPLVIQITFMF